MKDNTTFWSPAFDELGDELDRAARADGGSRPRRRRWVIAIVVVSMVSAPTAVALTSNNDDESVRVPAPGSSEAGPQERDQRQPPLIAPD